MRASCTCWTGACRCNARRCLAAAAPGEEVRIGKRTDPLRAGQTHLFGLGLEFLRVVLTKVSHAVLVQGEEVARGLVLGHGDEAGLRVGALSVNLVRIGCTVRRAAHCWTCTSLLGGGLDLVGDRVVVVAQFGGALCGDGLDHLGEGGSGSSRSSEGGTSRRKGAQHDARGHAGARQGLSRAGPSL